MNKSGFQNPANKNPRISSSEVITQRHCFTVCGRVRVLFLPSPPASALRQFSRSVLMYPYAVPYNGPKNILSNCSRQDTAGTRTMVVLHRQRGHPSTLLLPRCILENNKKPNYRKRSNTWLVFGSVSIAASTGLSVLHFYLLEEYAWVRRRCLTSWLLWWDTVAAVECVEARTHQLAEQDSTLWDRNIPRNVLFTVSPVQHVHYTITTPLLNQVLSLALCSMEAISKYCQEKKCIAHIWVVDKAFSALKSSEKSIWFDDIQNTLQNSQYCLHLVNGVAAETDELLGSACASSPCPESSRELRKWLCTRLASKQLPAHVSDAWRLVALADYGGLYLDADVLPLSPHILHLPLPSVPTQSKLGAYRLNGGVLALESPTCQSGRRSERRRSEPSFLEAMIQDHVRWAPRLAELPLSKQTFGFLGPCALTRVYLDRNNYAKPVTILPVNQVEGAVNEASICHDDSRLAIHFSGQRKKDWYGALAGSPCMQSRIHHACPIIFERHGLFA